MGNQVSRITTKRRQRSCKLPVDTPPDRANTVPHPSRGEPAQGEIEPALDRIDTILQKASEMHRHSLSAPDAACPSLVANDASDCPREHDRWQRQHYLLKYARKANIWSTLVSPHVIVDSGSGSGIWALEMAAEYTHAKVIGLDLHHPTVPANKPENLDFLQTDITRRWPMEAATVDFIFQRHMGLVIQKSQWLDVLREMWRVLKPGGKVELVECDRTHHHAGPTHQQLDDRYETFCDEHDFDFRFTESLATQIQDAGLELVNHRTFDIPIGEWSTDSELKKLGFINKEAEKAYMHQHKQVFLSHQDMSLEDYEREIQKLQRECDEYHGFTRFNCWMAQKPAH